MGLIASIRNLVISKPLLRSSAIATIKGYNNLVFTVSGKKGRYNANSPKQIDEYNKSRILGARAKICYAPFSNLYFGTTGAVTACCFNREYELGKYPENSINDIWYGDKADELRQHIEEGEFSLGCQRCALAIDSKNYMAVNAATYDYFTSNGKYPTRMDFELSNTCNLECIMCNGYCSSSIRKNREKKAPLPYPYDDAFVAQLEEYIPHLQYAKFLGGEPFLIDIYYQLWDKIAALSPDCLMYVQTNATVLNEKVKKVLANGRFNIGVSIDSLEKEKLESIRINSKYERVMENIHYFANYCKQKGTEFSICYSPMRNTVSELQQFIAYANSLNANAYFNTVYEPHNVAIWNLPSAQIAGFIQHLGGAVLPAKTPVERKNAAMFYSYVEQLKKWKEEAAVREHEMAVVNTNHLLAAALRVDGYIQENNLHAIEALDEKLADYYNLLPEYEKSIFEKIPEERLYNQILVFGRSSGALACFVGVLVDAVNIVA